MQICPELLYLKVYKKLSIFMVRSGTQFFLPTDIHTLSPNNIFSDRSVSVYQERKEKKPSTRPPSCRRRQAGRRCCRAATATLPLPTPPPCCQRRQHRALAKLPPLPPSWPLPLTPCSCQAATTAAKLAAALALSPRFRRHRRPLRFNCYHHHCHHRCFRAFS